MPESDAPPRLKAGTLEDLAAALADRTRAPVEHWNPPFCGDSGMRIAADGCWFHEGRPIARPAMVRLFAGVLRREADGSYVLVTPVEKLGIAVDDLPFVVTGVRSAGAGRNRRIACRLQTDEIVFAGPTRPIVAADARGRPALGLDRGLAARIARPVWYELADWALAEEGAAAGLWADGAFFALGAP